MLQVDGIGMLSAQHDRGRALSVSCYSVPMGTSPKWCSSFAEGCGGKVNKTKTIEPGTVAMFGSPALWHILMQAQAEGREWYYSDHAYLRRFEYYRVTRNAYQHDGTGDAKPHRFEQLGVPIKPWRTGGGHILVCPPDQPFADLFRFDSAAWMDNIMATLSQHTDRPIRVRQRKGAERAPVTLQQDLQDCWALVTYVSNAAVEAVLEGVPIFATGRCAASMMGLRDLSKIETPARPDRDQWAWNLADNQFTFDEMRSGLAWAKLKDSQC